MSHIVIGDKKFIADNDEKECLVARSGDNRLRLIIYHMERLVYTSRFDTETDARRFAVSYKPPPPPTKRQREKGGKLHE